MIAQDEIIVDLFAGGGGASLGIFKATGRHPDIAINHDPIAIAMHRANHPSTRHFCQDVWKVLPRQATKGKPVGFLWASPDCTDFSKAKGGVPIRDVKRRDLAWVVVRWAEDVRPRMIFLENVEEFTSWGPLDGAGNIIRSQRGTTFVSFVRKLRSLGYQLQWRELRACDYGAPTIRKRLFIIARCDGLPGLWPEITHGPGRKHPYRTAADIIDWSIPCPSIFARKKPLAEATLRRIANGIRRYVIETAEPFIVLPNHSCNPSFQGQDINRPLGTITSKASHALVTAFLAKHYGGPRQPIGQAISNPIGTITTVDHHSLVACHMIRHFGNSIGQPIDQPAPTAMSGVEKTGIVASHLVKLKGTSKDGQSLHEPLHTVQAGGLHYGEVRAFLMRYYGEGGQLGDCRDPVHTITTKDRLGLVTVRIDGEPYVIADIGMRMLSPRELFRAQGFGDDYRIVIEIDGKPISKADQVRLCGNSVSPPNAEALIAANLGGTGQATRCTAAEELLQLNMFAGTSAGPHR